MKAKPVSPPSPRHRHSGFTLVELLVVIAIIATLAGLITASVSVARRSATKKQAKMLIQELSAGLGNYLADWGDYPPSNMERYYEQDYAVVLDGVNTGVESLVAHLARQGKGGPYYEFKDEYVDNLDGDTLNDDALFEALDWVFGDRQLRELVDPWGNPYVYFHNSSYDDGPVTITALDKKRITVAPVRSEKTQMFQGLTTFQLMSLGPNGVFDGGDGDDVVSW